MLATRCRLLCTSLLLLSAARRASAQGLPPPDLRPAKGGSALQPSLDAGLLLGVCGIGEPQVWNKTRFCGSVLMDSLWGRRRESLSSAGVYAELGTAGFADFRASLGAAGYVPLDSWIGLGARLGPLLVLDSEARVGGSLSLEFGHRAYYARTRYSLTHALFARFDLTAKSHSAPSSTALWLGIRIDGFWLTAPLWAFTGRPQRKHQYR